MTILATCLAKDNRVFGRDWLRFSSFKALMDKLDGATHAQLDDKAQDTSDYNHGLAMTRQLLGARCSGDDGIRAGNFYWCPNAPRASSPWCSCHVTNVLFDSAANEKAAAESLWAMKRKQCGWKSRRCGEPGSSYKKGKKRAKPKAAAGGGRRRRERRRQVAILELPPARGMRLPC